MRSTRLTLLVSRLVFLALLGGAAALTLSCSADRSPLGVVRDTRGNLGLVDSLVHGTGLLSCTPLPFDSATRTIGPDGGTIQVGPHTFTVPAGALDSAVSITAIAPSGVVNVVLFQPEGLQFLQPASLTLSYANCNTLGANLPLNIAHVDDSLQILDYLKATNNPPSQTVTGRVPHFSGYAVAW